MRARLFVALLLLAASASQTPAAPQMGNTQVLVDGGQSPSTLQAPSGSGMQVMPWPGTGQVKPS